MSDQLPIYEQIGQGYDVTRKADPLITERLAHHLNIQANAVYLDVACGTGNYAIALSNYGGHWHGVDQSPRMITTAREKSRAIAWAVGEVDTLPYPDSFFSGIVCTLAIHHFKQLNTAFQEIHRVLSNGNFVLFTATPVQMENYWLMEYFPNAIRESANQMPSLEVVQDALRAAGFTEITLEPYTVQPTLQDFFLYSRIHGD